MKAICAPIVDDYVLVRVDSLAGGLAVRDMAPVRVTSRALAFFGLVTSGPC